jgi:predicted nucleic acid-binding protein
MIILDTNVLSEILRPRPDDGVLAWLARPPRASLFTTTITRAEVFYGVSVLPSGTRKQNLWDATLGIFNVDFSGQVLGFDSDAADAYAAIAAHRKSVARPISQFDAMIAEIARSRGATLATRNTKDFVDCGIEIVDPWNV